MTTTPRGRIDRQHISHLGEQARPGCRMFFTVSGNGTFPQDMLRYDGGACMDATGLPGERDIRAVRIQSAHGCTPARWRSFGWSVHDDIVESAAPVSVSINY